MKAIPIIYQGIQFRSKLECRHYNFMKRIVWSIEYEPEVNDVYGYQPDFELFSEVDINEDGYHYGDYQVPHNHRSVGVSGILYVNFNPNEHSATQVMQPWNDPITDAAAFMDLMPEEGTMILMPSFLIHFVNPNFTRNRRTILAFDLEVRE